MTPKQILSTLHQQIHVLQDQLDEKSLELARAVERISDLEARQNIPDDQYRLMFEANHAVKLLMDSETGSIIDANPAACRFYGYDKIALLGMKITDLSISPAEVAHLNNHEAYSGQQWVFHVRHRLANGDIRDVEVFVSPIHVNGRSFLYSTIHDITKRKLEETELRLLWHAVNQSANSILITDATGRIEYVNPYFTQLTGYTLEEVIGQNPRILKSGHTEAREYRKLWDTITSGREWVGEFHNQKKNGDLYWERARIAPVTNADGEITHFVAIKEDITDQKKAWEDLAQKEYTLRRSQAIAHVGDWTWETKPNIVHWSDEMYRIFGVDRDKFTGDLSAVIDQTIHPDDRDKVLASNQAVVEEGKPNGMEYRVVWSDGSVRYVWAQPGEKILDAKNNIISLSGIVQDITERKQAEIQIYEAERFARATVNALSVHIAILDETGVILAVNDAWTRFAERNNAKLDAVGVGINYLTVLETIDPTGEDADTALAALTGIQQALRGEIETFSLEYPCHAPDEQRWFNISVTRFAGNGPTRLVVAHKNVTERVLAQQQLADANAQLEEQVAERTKELLRLNDRMSAVLNNVSNPVLLVSADGSIDVTNPILNRVLGYQMDELFDQSLWRIFETTYRPALMDLFQTMDEYTPLGPIQTQLVTKSGTTFDAEVSFTKVPGNRGHVVCTLYNISHLKEMERIKDEFISMVSHELRTPITSIMLSASTLQRHFDHMTDDKKLQKMARITEQAQALADFVTSILDVSRFDARQGKRGQETVNVSQALENVVSELAEQAESRHQHIQVEVVSGGLTVMGEYSDLIQVWRNLLNNAIKYTPDGGSIRAVLYGAGSTHQYQAAGLNGFRDRMPADIYSGRYLIGLVEDTGHGIRLEDLPHLFTRFFRGWATGTSITGSGLGLSLVRDLLRLYGGDIAVSSTLNIETTFCFWLPVNEGE